MPSAHQSTPVPPPGWSWPDWLEEIEAVCLARAFEASRQFDPSRGVPVAAFVHTQVHFALSERYRQESRFGAHCHAASLAIRDPANPEVDIDRREGTAVLLALQALPVIDRELLERLVLKGDSKTDVARNLGVSRRTISRRKDKLLDQIRAAQLKLKNVLTNRARKPAPGHYQC